MMSIPYLNIDQDDSVRQIKKRFSGIFPFLTINLFKNASETPGRKAGAIIFCPEVTMKQANDDFHSGSVPITESMTVEQFEKTLLQQFGVFAEVSANDKYEKSISAIQADGPLMLQNEPQLQKKSFRRENALYFKDIPFGC